MADDMIDRVRSVDPLPSGSAAPPFERVYAEMTTPPADSRPRSRSSWLTGLVVPAITVAGTVGVIAVVVVASLAGPSSRVGHRVSRQPDTGGLSAPTRTPTPQGGMPGFVTVWGAGFNAAGAGAISLEQCLHCRPDGNQTKSSTDHDWLVSTDDGGKTWSLSPTDYYVQMPDIGSHSGWSGGVQLITKRESVQEHLPAQWEPGAGTPLFFTSDDAGRNWSVAPSPAQALDGESVSSRGGEVWAIGYSSHPVIVHAALEADRLTATIAQPPLSGYDTNVHVVAAGPNEAYVVNANERSQAYATHDNGSIWTPMTAPPCTGANAYADVLAAYAQTVWLTCVGGTHPTPQLERSVDGGQTWSQLPENWGPDGPEQFTAVSANDAWALTARGVLLRTTDAGSTWAPVWSLTDVRAHPLSGPLTSLSPSPLPILSVQSAESASIVTLLNRDQAKRAAGLTNLVAYRTSNAGQTWNTYVVPLARGSNPRSLSDSP